MVYLLASLPETYDMLVTALEANMDVPQMEVVKERLLHKERKLKGREDDREQQKAMTAWKPRCFKCGKPGHMKRDCPLLAKDGKKPGQKKGGGSGSGGGKHRANQVSGGNQNSE